MIEKRSKECPLERQRRLNKQKEYDNEKRFAESQIERQRTLTQDKEYHSQKRSAEQTLTIRAKYPPVFESMIYLSLLFLTDRIY